MRPLIVLLLVIAGLTAFLLTFDFGGSDDVEPTEVDGAPVESPATPPRAAPGILSGATQDREEGAPKPGAAAPSGQRDPVLEANTSNSLVGKVVDQQGKPVSNADITLTKAGRSNPFTFIPDRSSDRKARTDDKGVYQFQNVEPFKGYALVVLHPDYKLTEVGQVDVGISGKHEEPDIVLGPGVRVHGWVRDTSGGAVDAADVALGAFVIGAGDEFDPNVLRTRTGPDGHYELKNVDLGVFTMTVSKEGYGSVAQQNLQINSMEDAQYDFELEAAEMIMGTVTSMEGEPIEGAQVSAFAIMKRAGKQSRSTVETLPDGTFAFDDIPAGTYTVLVNADGYDPDRLPRIDSGTMNLDFRLARQAVVSGQVVDAATREPVKKFWVQFRSPIPDSTDSLPDTDSRKNFDNAKGEFQIPCGSPGSYLVQATADGYASSFSTVFNVNKGQDVSGIVVAMTQGGSIQGRVVDPQGNPIARATITSQANDWSDDLFMQTLGDQMPSKASVVTVRSKSDGTFELKGLTPALYLVDVRHSDFARLFSQGHAVREGAATMVGDIRLTKGGTVQGKVHGPDGGPLSGAIIQLSSLFTGDETPRIYTAKSSSEGIYSIANVYPAMYSIQTIRSTDAGAGPFDAVLDLKETRETVNVGDGQTVIKDFHLGMKSGVGK